MGISAIRCEGYADVKDCSFLGHHFGFTPLQGFGVGEKMPF